MIDVKRDGPVAVLSATDYGALSRHDLAFAVALRDAVVELSDSDEVKALVLRSTGNDFAPPLGADACVSPPFGAAWHAAYAACNGLYQSLAFCKKIVVTAVRGRCHDAGSMLVLCSDHTVCAADGEFGSPFERLPEANLVLAALTVRLNRAKSWMLAGQPWSARQACERGLVNCIEDAAAVDALALQMAHAAARTPLDGIAMSKIQIEALLDAQGAGTDFDAAGLFAQVMAGGGAS